MALNLEEYRAKLRAAEHARRVQDKAQRKPAKATPALVVALADMREYDALAGEAIQAALGIAPGAVADAIEAEIVQREVALGAQAIQRTHALPGKVRPQQVERDHDTARAYREAAQQGKVPEVMGKPDSLRAHKAVAASEHAAAVEARRQAKRDAQARRGR